MKQRKVTRLVVSSDEEECSAPRRKTSSTACREAAASTCLAELPKGSLSEVVGKKDR